MFVCLSAVVQIDRWHLVFQSGACVRCAACFPIWIPWFIGSLHPLALLCSDNLHPNGPLSTSAVDLGRASRKSWNYLAKYFPSPIS